MGDTSNTITKGGGCYILSGGMQGGEYDDVEKENEKKADLLSHSGIKEVSVSLFLVLVVFLEICQDSVLSFVIRRI